MKVTRIWPETKPWLGIVRFIVILLLSLTACGHVPIQDEEVCLALPIGMGGHCHDTLTSAERDISEPGWGQMQPGRLSESATAFASWKIALESLCNETKTCELNTQVQNMRKQLDAIVTMTQQTYPQPTPKAPILGTGPVTQHPLGYQPPIVREPDNAKPGLGFRP